MYSVMQSHLIVPQCFHSSTGNLKEGQHKRSANGPLTEHVNIWLLDRLRSVWPDISTYWETLRWLQIVIECISYSHAAASEHMRYLSTQQLGPPLQLCFSPPLPLVLSLSHYVCVGHSRRSIEKEESNAFPAIWNELKTYVAVVWHGKKGMERPTSKEGKAVGRCNSFQNVHMVFVDIWG